MRTYVRMKIIALLGLALFCGQAAWTQAGKLEFVESGVTLRLSAPAQADGSRKVVLLIQTNDVYECANTFLENDAVLEGDKLNIKVKGVRIPETCDASMGPAFGRVDLTKLGPGKYPVSININRQLFKAKLEITDTYYDFSIPSEDPVLFRIYNPRLNLIPAQSIWGICSYSAPEKKAEALAFMKALEAAGATPTQLAVGNYDDFYLHTTGATEEKIIRDDLYEYPFIYHYAGDPGDFADLLQAYKGKLEISLKDAKGGLQKNF